jgi:hypothetical protein
MEHTLDKKLIVVAGVSSSGKSTFIDEHLLNELAVEGFGRNEDVDIKFAGKLFSDFDLGSKTVCIVHYNTLVKFDRYSETETLDLLDEFVFNKLLASQRRITLYLCYTPDTELLRRIEARESIEPIFAPNSFKYPKLKVQANFSKVDQRQLLIQCAEYFKTVTNDMKVVFSMSGSTEFLTYDEFRYGLPSDRLENIIKK